ncbi:MAG: hypothetical protein J5795_04470 [Lachnospiraceae bacterium]|nr:hypothetical protein [Lachnospiraceae bacterium]
MKRMNRIRTCMFLLFACALILTACGTGTNGKKKPTIDSDGISAPTEKLTGKPTAVPTETPDDPTGTIARMQRSRELHESVMTKQPVSAVGTGPQKSAQDLLDYEYGITRYNNIRSEQINMETGEAANYQDPDVYLTVYGLADEAFNQRVNEKCLAIRAAMRDPDYIPNVSGFLAFVEEKGTPSIETRGNLTYHRFGILSGYMCGEWIWKEEKAFSSPEEEREFHNSCVQMYPGFSVFYRYEEYDYDTGASKGYIYYSVSEYVGFTFDISTGEELSLSDLFPEGYDYLDYLNGEIEKKMKSSEIGYDEGYAHEHYTGGGTFFLESSEWLCFFPKEGSMEVDLPFIPANRDPEGTACQKPVTYSPSPIANVYVCGVEIGDSPNLDVKVGDFRVTGSTGQAVTVSVYREKGYPKDVCLPERLNESILQEQLSDEIYLNMAKQSAAHWSADQRPKSDCIMIIYYAYAYPNNYFFAHWIVYNITPEGYLSYFRGYEEWLRNGRVLTIDDLLNVSVEEFLKDILTGAYVDDFVMTREQAAAVAKAIRPYIVDIDYKLNGFCNLRREGAYIFTEKFDPAGMKEELKYLLPENVLDCLFSSYSSKFLSYADSLTALKHLRIYDGYSFK